VRVSRPTLRSFEWTSDTPGSRSSIIPYYQIWPLEHALAGVQLRHLALWE
jgi:hypothetical protein